MHRFQTFNPNIGDLYNSDTHFLLANIIRFAVTECYPYEAAFSLKEEKNACSEERTNQLRCRLCVKLNNMYLYQGKRKGVLFQDLEAN